MSFLIVIFLALWLAATIFVQICGFLGASMQRLRIALLHRDPFHLLPSYLFFAPTPVGWDFEILYRDRLTGGDLTGWTAVPLPNGSVWRPLWNPARRIRHATMDVCLELVRSIQCEHTTSQISESLPYLTLLSCVTNSEHCRQSCEAQFMIVLSFGFETGKKAKRAYVSPFFNLC
jgi:hypothetical protein